VDGAAVAAIALDVQAFGPELGDPTQGVAEIGDRAGNREFAGGRVGRVGPLDPDAGVGVELDVAAANVRRERRVKIERAADGVEPAQAHQRTLRVDQGEIRGGCLVADRVGDTRAGQDEVPNEGQVGIDAPAPGGRQAGGGVLVGEGGVGGHGGDGEGAV